MRALTSLAFALALLGALAAVPSAQALIVDQCVVKQVSVSPTIAVCKAHSGASGCPGSASESTSATVGSVGVGEADSGSCDVGSNHSGIVFVAVYSGGAQHSVRWQSGSGNDPRDITILAGGMLFDWHGSTNGPCSIYFTGAVTTTQNCLLAPPPALPGLGYGALVP